MIQQLGSDVISELRSGVALTCLAQCVEELVYNSIEAGSTSITVDVDMSTFSFEVSDNGKGLSQSDLKNAGRRYFTSKCHNLIDLENAASYGFRGEALASLGKICQKVEVISRHKTSSRTFCKLVRKGQDMGVYESTSLRPKHGITVKVTGVFYTLPVRQKLISDKVDLEQIRRRVLALALMNPTVSFLVRNRENGCTLFQSHACTSALSVISQIFGCAKSKAFKPVSQKHGAYMVTGYVSLEGCPNKSLQFFYVNKRLVLKTRFHDVTNHILARGISGLMVTYQQPGIVGEGLSTPKKLGKYARFVINLQCPCNSYDITFDPEKTLVEFENWDEPILCLKLCLVAFLKKEGLFKDEFCESECSFMSNTQGSCSSSSEEMLELDSVKSNAEICKPMSTSIKASDLRRSLYSSTAKRKQDVTSEEIKSFDGKNYVSSGHASSSSVLSCATSKRSRNGKGFFKENTFKFSDENHSRNENCSTLRKVLSQPDPRRNERSILPRLQKYSFPQSGTCPCESNCEQPSKKNELNLNMEHELTKSYDGKRISLCSRESKELNKKSDNRFLRKTIASRQLQDSTYAKNVLSSEREEDLLISRCEETEFLTSTMSSFHHEIQNVPMESLEYETDEENRVKQCPVRKAYCGKTNFCRLEDADMNVCTATRRMSSFEKLRDFNDFGTSYYPGSLKSDNTATASTDENEIVKATASIDTNNEPPNKDSDWLFQCNPHDGRPVYVNVRTGNTSIMIPPCKPTVSLLEKPSNSRKPVPSEPSKQRPFHPFASHLSHNFTPWLPRSVCPSSNQRKMSSFVEKRSSEIGDMLDQWINPVFESNRKPVADARFTDGNKTSIKVQKTGQPFKFTKDCFNNLKVISQVDNKFILCKYQGNEDNLLVVVDQHAAHERVRLETFIKDLYINCPVSGNKMVLKSSPLHTPCILSMCDHDIHLMRAFRAQFQQVGITFEEPTPSSRDTDSSVHIKTVPSVFLAREFLDDGDALRTEIKTCIEDLIKEQIEVMLSTKGAPTTALPKAITRVLNSLACHGAIRFGDSLSTEECINLMTLLSKCDLPFQCAHGRPSMIPLISMKLTKNAMSKKMTSLPQICRIKKEIKGKLK